MKRRLASIATAIALLGTGAAAGVTVAASSPASASVTHQMPKWVHWKYAAKGACGQHKRGVVIYDFAREHGQGDTESVLVCPDGSIWLP
jgi:uncharacterized low-complexity protein